MEELHIGKMIKAELKAQERTVTWLANHIPCHRTNVYKIFSNSNIDLKMLTRISEVLDHNFFLSEGVDMSICDAQMNDAAAVVRQPYSPGIVGLSH